MALHAPRPSSEPVGISRPDGDRAASTLVPLHHRTRRAGRRRRRPDRRRHGGPRRPVGRRDRAADRRGLEQARTDHRDSTTPPAQDLAAKRKQADALAEQIAPLQRQVDAAMDKVSALAVRAYKGEQRLDRQRAAGQPVARASWSTSSKCSTSFAHHQQQERRRRWPTCATSWPRRRRRWTSWWPQLTRTEAQLAAKKKQINAEIDRLQKLRLKVYGNGGGGPLRPAPCPAELPRRRRRHGASSSPARRSASLRLGRRGPELVRLLRADAGRLGARPASRCRTTPARSSRVTKRVSRADLQPGDLVFYYSDLHHVGMYVGGGWVVHASPGRRAGHR